MVKRVFVWRNRNRIWTCINSILRTSPYLNKETQHVLSTLMFRESWMCVLKSKAWPTMPRSWKLILCFIFIIFILCLWAYCLDVCKYTHVVQCPRTSEEGLKSPGSRVTKNEYIKIHCVNSFCVLTLGLGRQDWLFSAFLGSCFLHFLILHCFPHGPQILLTLSHVLGLQTASLL